MGLWPGAVLGPVCLVMNSCIHLTNICQPQTLSHPVWGLRTWPLPAWLSHLLALPVLPRLGISVHPLHGQVGAKRAEATSALGTQPRDHGDCVQLNEGARNPYGVVAPLGLTKLN